MQTEWEQLEASAAEDRNLHCPRDAAGREYLVPWDSGVKHSNAPHRRSYGASLPMRGLGLGDAKRTHKWTLTAAEKQWLAKHAADAPATTTRRAKIRPNAPHPESYRADLPIRSELGGRNTRKWTLTAAEKATLAGRPLRYAAAS